MGKGSKNRKDLLTPEQYKQFYEELFGTNNQNTKILEDKNSSNKVIVYDQHEKKIHRSSLYNTQIDLDDECVKL
jgi:hypothetical protein